MHKNSQLIESTHVGLASRTLEIYRSLEKTSATAIFYVMNIDGLYFHLFKSYSHYMNWCDGEYHERCDLTRTEYDNLEKISIDTFKTEMYEG